MSEITREEFTAISHRTISSETKIAELEKDVNHLGAKLTNEVNRIWERGIDPLSKSVSSMLWKVFLFVTVPVVIGFAGIIVSIYRGNQ